MFEQEKKVEKKENDLLFVIDNSGSMGQTVEIKNKLMLEKMKGNAEKNLKKRLAELQEMKEFLEEGEYEVQKQEMEYQFKKNKDY